MENDTTQTALEQEVSSSREVVFIVGCWLWDEDGTHGSY